MFLSAEVQDGPDLLASAGRRQEGGTAVEVREVAGDGAPTKKKCKLDVSSSAPATDSVSWTICSMDGATLSVAVPGDVPVAELKRAIGVLREVLHDRAVHEGRGGGAG
jgi:hypothetical protein